MNKMTQFRNDNAVEAVLCMALELSDTRWRLDFGDTSKSQLPLKLVRVPAKFLGCDL